MSRRLATYGALGWLTLVAAVGLLAPWLPLLYDASAPDLTHFAVAPSWRGPSPHYLGTDPLGRDVLAGLVVGARHLVLVLLPATTLATAAGALLGGAAGYWGNRQLRLPLPAALLALAAGWWWLHLPPAIGLVLGLVAMLAGRRRGLLLPLDSLVLGLATLLGVVPRLLLLLAVAAGPPLSSSQLLLLLALLAWPDTARLVRSQMQSVRVAPFVEAARALGLRPVRVWWRHALPAAGRPLRAFAPLTLAALVGLDTTLAFLGVGAAPATNSWGQLLGALRQEPGAWWLVTGPGLALLITLLALQLLAQPAAD